jgi:hypothetical protein
MRILFASVLLCTASIVHGQAIKPEPPMRSFTETEVSAVTMPDLKFAETPEIIENYDKYFFFHRADTSFDQAFEDISRCDALSAGISFSTSMDISPALVQYGVLGGAVGGVIGNVIGDAVFGSAERRRIRRINMRNCMGFKGYARYGLEKDLWQTFNFEEGGTRVTGKKRTDYLLKQARVASGAIPQLKAIQQ